MVRNPVQLRWHGQRLQVASQRMHPFKQGIETGDPGPIDFIARERALLVQWETDPVSFAKFLSSGLASK